MKLQFFGAAGTVTGSRYLLTSGDLNILVDAGLFQGFKNLRLKNWHEFPLDPANLDAVILTHAHLDHSGYIPLLVKNGFRGSIYCTSATKDLCKILLPDSGYLQEEEAKYANKRGYSKHNPALPLYTVEDAEKSLDFFVSKDWQVPFEITGGGSDRLKVEFHPAGHLLGAASVTVRSSTQSIAFSGDLGRSIDPLVRSPDFHEGVSHVVIESTYGNKIHPATDTESELKDIITRTLLRRGILLIPSFAVGRAQLILYYLLQLRKKKAIPLDLPIYLNSPMAVNANAVFEKHLDELKISAEEVREIGKFVKIVKSPEDSIALNESKEPAVIIAASGMATGGRVLHHLKSLISFPQNTVLFVGFQAGGTRGDLIVHGADRIKIHGEHWPVRAEIVNMETLSAHADSNELISWLKGLKQKPKNIYVTHGEPQAAEALRIKIFEELQIEAQVAEQDQIVEIK